MSIEIMLGWQATVPDDFKKDAACRGMDPELFMPSVGKHGKEAKEVCNGRTATRRTPGLPPCPVKDKCLEYCLSLPGPVVGIWGGTTERDRRIMKREPVATPRRFHHGTAHGYRLHMEMKTPPCDACRRAHNDANKAWRDRARDKETMPALRKLVETISEAHRDAASRNAD
jgi:WhiB family redox-sensing transcriptional regulator